VDLAPAPCGTRSLKVVVAIFAYNEDRRLDLTLARFPHDRDYDVLIMDDGSTDGSTDRAEAAGFTVLRNATNTGIGAAMQRVIHYARDAGYDTLIMFAGNDKDRPEDIPRLLEPIRRGECKLVQGSRYVHGGRSGGMPLYRRVATRFVHPWLFSIASRRRIHDSTNGFRAIDLSLFDDPRINLTQSWLNAYELEPYILYKAIRLGAGVKEVPVTKIYPPRALGNTKMKPLTGWWSILRPIFLLGFGLRR
jgi:dolichol-phosphate mannosyltransferase